MSFLVKGHSTEMSCGSVILGSGLPVKPPLLKRHLNDVAEESSNLQLPIYYKVQ